MESLLAGSTVKSTVAEMSDVSTPPPPNSWGREKQVK